MFRQPKLPSSPDAKTHSLLKNSRRASSSIFAVLDRLLLHGVALLGAIIAPILLFAPSVFLPAEDAAILFQFSRNLAHTGVICFSPSGPRAEGATDFAWMALLSLGIKFHLDPFWLTALVNAVSITVLAVLLLNIAGRRPTVRATLFLMGTFALMPQIFAAASGFSTLPFACLLVALALSFLTRKILPQPSWPLSSACFAPME